MYWKMGFRLSSLVARSSRMHAETLRQSRPPLFRGRPQRSVSIAPDHRVLGFAAWERALAFPLSGPSCSCPMSRSVSQSLADDAAQRPTGTLDIINAKSDALVVPEIELGQIPFQMFFADVVVHADNPAFKDREITFYGVGVRIAANVFLRRVIDGLMAGEAISGLPVDAAFIGPQVRLRRNLFSQNGLQIGRSDVRDMKGRDAAFALYQCDHG